MHTCIAINMSEVLPNIWQNLAIQETEQMGRNNYLECRQCDFFATFQSRYGGRAAMDILSNYIHNDCQTEFITRVEIPELVIMGLKDALEYNEAIEPVESNPDCIFLWDNSETINRNIVKLRKHIQALES